MASLGRPSPNAILNDDDEEEDSSIHRLAASAPVVGGLVIKKKQSGAASAEGAKDPIMFRKPALPAPPKPSLLGLDRLAALKRQQEAELRAESPNRIPVSKLKSFRDEDDKDLRPPTPRDGAAVGDRGRSPSHRSNSDSSAGNDRPRNFRPHREETPSHPGGVTQSVRRELDQRKRNREERGVYAATDKEKKKKKKKDGDDEDDDERRRRHKEKKKRKKEGREDESERKGDVSERSSRVERQWDETPRGKRDEDDDLEPDSTPLPDGKGPKDTPSNTNWEEDEPARGSGGKSGWDFPTPSVHGGSSSRSSSVSRDFPTPTSSSSRRPSSNRVERIHDRTERGFRRDNGSNYTPAATPSHNYNSWAPSDVKKSTKYTPRETPGGGEAPGDLPYGEDDGGESKEEWEEEQKKLDRAWYGLDEGYDDEKNPFAGVGETWTRKKEQAAELRKKKRVSARQRDINADNEKWEKNRMVRSDVVRLINVDDDFEEEEQDKVHLLVHNIAPPFLDGRIAFTKQVRGFCDVL